MPLSSLNAEQLSAVNAPLGHNLIIASAGTGKTSTIVGRIAKLLKDGVNPREILLLTFTNKAANEMISRLERHFDSAITKQINAGTFHAVAYRYLKEHSQIALKQPRELKTLLKSILNVRRFSDEVAHYKAEYLYDLMSLFLNTTANSACGDFSRSASAHSLQRTPSASHSFASHNHENSLTILEFAESSAESNSHIKSFSDFIIAKNAEQEIHSAIYDDIFSEFMEVKRQYNYASYDDLLLLYRTEILAKNISFCEVLVDEYQDTNALQNSIISAFRVDSLFCVGDYDQSIYAFNGADIGIIASFDKRYKDAKIFSLNKNYRSTRKILAVANKVIANNPRIYPKSLEVVSDSDDSRVEILRFQKTKEQYSFIAKHIAESALNGARLSDIAIIFRNNTSADFMEAGLREYGIACRKKGGRSFFESREVALFIDILSLFGNSADMMAFVNIISNGAQIGEVIAKEIYEALSALGNGDILRGLLRPQNIANPYKNRARNAQLGLFDEIFIKEDSARFNRIVSKDFASHPILCHPKLNEKSAVFLDRFYKLFAFKGRDLNTLFDFVAKSEFFSDLKAQIIRTRSKNAGEKDLEEFSKAFDKKIAILRNLAQNYDNLSHFLNQIVLNSAESTSGEGVNLLTIHASKGLEFESVYIIDLMDGRFPNFKLMAKTGSLEEERRLFYVATTRAKRNLYYCFAHFDSTKNANYLPSTFLKEAGLV